MKDKKGSLMIELIVALFLVIVGILGIVNLLTKSFYFNFETYNRLIGTNLAIEGIEIVKNIIDANIALSSTNWSNISSGIYEVDYSCFDLQCKGAGWSVDNTIVNELFFKNNASYFKFDNISHHYNYDQGDLTNFKRVVKVERRSSDSIKVNSYVYWTYKGREYLINLEDNFYNWR